MSHQSTFQILHEEVSINNGTPKSSSLIGFSIINHPFWGAPIFGNTHVSKSKISRDVHWCGFSVRRPPLSSNEPLGTPAFHCIHPFHCHVIHFCHVFHDAFDTFGHRFFFKLQLLLQQFGEKIDWCLAGLNFWMLKLYIPSVSFPTKELLCKGSKKRKVPLVCNFFFLVDFGKSIYSIQVSKCLCFQQISRIVALVNFKW